MRWTYFIFLQCLLIAVVGTVVYIHKDKVNVHKTPPASLAKWYKPENKRQEWLHNMFKLRREIQAVKLYSTSNEDELLDKWTAQLSKHYLRISEMVPEWDKKLDEEALTQLQTSVKNRDQQGVSLALDDLNTSCNSCHQDYRSTVATMYRAPDFSSIKLSQPVAYKEHMKALITQVNQIKIASEDGKRDVALSSLSELKHGIQLQGETCVQCHKKETKLYPDVEMTQTIANLEQSLSNGTLKEQGKALGTLAVQVCASCHGTHRIAYDNRKVFVDGPNWRELIKH
ncbi:MAG: cytochrome c [Piscirickettsiaceae bacterium]|nr:cytochrome c [Piscirickettsiaceae bacterium]